MSIVSLSTFKEYLPEVQGTGSDTELQNILDRVESSVAIFLGYPRGDADGSTSPTLASVSYEFYVDAPFYNNPNALYLPMKPVTAVASWHSDVERLYGSDTAIASDQYDLDTVNGRLYLKSTSTATIESGVRANKVVCTAGYSTVPNDLEHAICVYASMLQRAKSSQGKENTTQRDVTVKFSPRTMPQEVKDILNPFRVYQRIL
tara:strand:- start:400 stop:1011 length:612 start_codon:yes stop_codon:yes gene_type:complete